MPQTEQQNNIQDSFNLSLIDPNLQNLGVDLIEMGIDSILNDGIIKDIPIINTIVALSKIGANIHDRLFLKKIIFFLNQLKDIPSSKREEMLNKINDSKKYKIKVGEKLLYIIDSCEDYEISERIGVLFVAYIEEKITYDDFLKTVSVLKNLNSNDFNWFINREQMYNFNIEDINEFLGSGLFSLFTKEINVHVKDKDSNSRRGLVKPSYAFNINRSSFVNNDKYDTEVEGGDIGAHVSSAGEIILEIFKK